MSYSAIPLLRVVRVRDGSSPSHGVRIACAADVAAKCRPLAPATGQEAFWLLPLDAQGRALGVLEMFRGAGSSCTVDVAVLLSVVLAMPTARAFIVCHNHPAGACEPSAADRATTKRLREAGEVLGRPLVDHVIVEDSAFYSFADRGWS